MANQNHKGFGFRNWLRIIRTNLYKTLNGYSPFRFDVQPSICDECNLACDFCPIHSPLVIRRMNSQSYIYENEKQRIMSLDAFDKIINNIKDSIKMISICGRGEPLLNKNFKDIINRLDMYNIPFGITTNGYNLEENIDFLTNARNLVSIRLSDNYRKIQVPIHNKINISNVYTLRTKHLSGPGDSPAFYVPGLKNLCVLNEGFSKEFFLSYGCKIPFHFVVIDTEGFVYPCCHSYYVLGNVADTSLKSIVNRPQSREFRKTVLSGKLNKSDCYTCGHYSENKSG